MSIVIHLSMGTVAALLTVSEFILSALSALAARASLHGVWLLLLHRTRTARVTSSARARRAKIRDGLSAVLGIWLVVSVALVESNLEASVLISSETTSENCVPMNGTLNSRLLSLLVPSLRVAVEPWVQEVAQKARCEALASVPTGRKSYMGAPTCTTRVPLPIVSHVHQVRPDHAFLATNRGAGSSLIELFPHDTRVIQNIPKLQDDFGTSSFKEAPGACTQAGISSLHSALNAAIRWHSVFTQSSHMARAVHAHVCAMHATTHANRNATLDIVQPEAATRCTTHDSTFLVPSCLAHLPQVKVYSTTLRNMSVFMIQAPLQNYSDSSRKEDKAFVTGRQFRKPPPLKEDRGTSDEKSYVCLSASVSFSYVFVSPETISDMNFSFPLPVEYPVLIPVSYKILNNNDNGNTDTYTHCERVAHVLGRAALVYSSDAMWRQTRLGMLSDVTRYHTFLIAAGSAQFPLTDLNATSSDEWCAVRGVHDVTQMPFDWRFVLFLTAATTAAVLCLLALVFRFWYRGKAWIVGTAHWALKQMEQEQQKQMRQRMIKKAKGRIEEEEDGDEGELEIEVVVESTSSSKSSFHKSVHSGGGNGNGNGVERTAELQENQERQHDTGDHNSNSNNNNNSLTHRRSLMHGFRMEAPFTYQLRTVTKSKGRGADSASVRAQPNSTMARQSASGEEEEEKPEHNPGKREIRCSCSDTGSEG